MPSLSTNYRVESATFLVLELGVLFWNSVFLILGRYRPAKTNKLWTFCHRMMVVGASLHIIVSGSMLYSTYGWPNGYLGVISINLLPLPILNCVFFFVGNIFELYFNEFLYGQTSAVVWRVLLGLQGAFVVIIIISLSLMYAFNQRRFNVITTMWLLIECLVALCVILVTTYRIHKAATSRASRLGTDLTSINRLLRIVSLASACLLLGAGVASFGVAYSFGHKSGEETVRSGPPDPNIYWDWFWLDAMYIVFHYTCSCACSNFGVCQKSANKKGAARRAEYQKFQSTRTQQSTQSASSTFSTEGSDPSLPSVAMEVAKAEIGPSELVSVVENPALIEPLPLITETDTALSE